MADPTNLGVLDDLKFITRFDIFPVIAGEFTLRSASSKIYEAATEQQIADLMNVIDDMARTATSRSSRSRRRTSPPPRSQAQIDDAPVVKLINAILTDAVKRGASDIHFECFEHEIRVRYRIDGALQEIMKPPIKLKAALISRFKIMAQLNIAERRVPQDGRIKLKIGKKVIDFRVSTLPTLFGEKIVLRILDKGNLTLDLEKFGIEPKAEADLMEAISNPYGMVLVTGPTGSGKTTTLYSALSKINNIDVNIMTAEDPVEYNLLRHQSGAGADRDRDDLRRRAEGVPSSGPEHHHGRRDPRPRDRRHRHQGGAHRPPGALAPCTPTRRRRRSPV